MQKLNLPWLEPTFGRLPAALPAALLLSGQKGLGKEAFALALAQSRLCEATASPGQGCGSCPSCHLFAAGNHPDFRLLTPGAQSDEAVEGGESQRGSKQPSPHILIAAVREIAELASMTPHRGIARVVVISPAESLHHSAANALLKLLEEPPENMHFLLVSHQPHRLPKTILSRCFRLAADMPAMDTARDWLREQVGNRGELALAMGAFAPVAAANLAEDEDYWQHRRVLLDELWRENGDPLAMAQFAEPMEPAMLAGMLQMCCHDLLAARHGLPVRYHRDYEDQVRAQSLRWNPQAVAQWQDEVLRFARSASHPLNRRLALEALFASLPISEHA
jgi:DNA polymerase-3 subunit delta'